jgi:hypothetical protein
VTFVCDKFSDWSLTRRARCRRPCPVTLDDREGVFQSTWRTTISDVKLLAGAFPVSSG